MSEDRFDVIVVGGGPAGNAAALTLAKAGMEVLVVERGNWCGAKNVSGGRLYGHSLEKLIPGFAKEAPIERKIVKERVSMMTEDASSTIEFSDEKMRDVNCASYSVLRSKFDKWFAEKAEAEGAMYATGILVDEVIKKDGKVCGVRCGEEEMFADAVILADGVNSLLAQSLGMKEELRPTQVAVGVKEVIALDEQTISDRFGVDAGEGVAWLMAGFPSAGGIGGGCLYTNKESVSLAMVLTVDEIGKTEYSTPELYERMKHHPALKPLLKGGRVLEYSAHLVTEGGYTMIPKLYDDGVLVTGDAAALVINIGYTVRGMDFAIESGRLAAETLIKAKEKKDYSANMLSTYKQMLDDSFVIKTMKHYSKAPKMMEHKEIYGAYPKMMNDIMEKMFIVTGEENVRMKKVAMKALKESGGIFKLAKVGMDAMGAL